MKNEIISYKLRLISKGNAFQPLQFTSEKLIEEKIIASTDELEVAHPGELVSYFKMKNGNIIKVNRNEISVTVASLSETENLFEKLKMIFPNARLIEIDLDIDEHFIDTSYPESIFEKFISVKGMELDIFRYKKDDLMFVVYSCQPHHIHLKIELKVILEKSLKFEDLKFEEALTTKAITENRRIFIDSILKK